jgi:vacuolar-type H+-ATPase subunit I/STV1
MDGDIQFIANYDDWKAIKKIKITSATDPRTVIEFLASLTYSVDNKVEVNLRKIVKLEEVDKAIEEINFSKGDISKAIEEVTSRKISKIINEITEVNNFQKNVQKEIQGFCKVYALRKALAKCGLLINYSDVDIPGMSRLKKAKK